MDVGNKILFIDLRKTQGRNLRGVQICQFPGYGSGLEASSGKVCEILSLYI